MVLLESTNQGIDLDSADVDINMKDTAASVAENTRLGLHRLFHPRPLPRPLPLPLDDLPPFWLLWLPLSLVPSITP